MTPELTRPWTEERLEAVASSGLTDPRHQERLRFLVWTVAEQLDAPMAHLTLVHRDHQFFVAHFGLPANLVSTRRTPIDESLCAYVVDREDDLSLDDLLQSEFVDHKALTQHGIHAYLGVPVKSPHGVTIGSLCALDRLPRHWTPEDVETLHRLAIQVMAIALS